MNISTIYYGNERRFAEWFKASDLIPVDFKKVTPAKVAMAADSWITVDIDRPEADLSVRNKTEG